MSETEFLQEAGVGVVHIGESRSTASVREFRALSRFLRANGFYETAIVVDSLLTYQEHLEGNQMPFGV